MTVAALLASLCLSPFGISSQQENFWNILAQVEFKSTVDKNGYTVEKPIFSKYLKSFNGKPIKLKGYLIPLGETGGNGKYMFSLLPFNVCYFCGAAGPETVIQLESSQKFEFSTRQITMEGILVLNDTDPDNHIYILKQASTVR